MGVINVNWDPSAATCNPKADSVPKYDENGILMSMTPDANDESNKVCTTNWVGNKIRQELFGVYCNKVWEDGTPVYTFDGGRFIGVVNGAAYFDFGASMIEWDINTGRLNKYIDYDIDQYSIRNDCICTDTHLLLHVPSDRIVRYNINTDSIDYSILSGGFEYHFYENHNKSKDKGFIYALKTMKNDDGSIVDNYLVRINYTSDTDVFIETIIGILPLVELNSICYRFNDDDTTTILVAGPGNILCLTDSGTDVATTDISKSYVNIGNIKSMDICQNCAENKVYISTDNKLYYIQCDDDGESIVNSLTFDAEIHRTISTSNNDVVVTLINTNNILEVVKYSKSLNTAIYQYTMNDIYDANSCYSYENDNGCITLVSIVDDMLVGRHDLIDNIEDVCRVIDGVNLNKIGTFYTTLNPKNWSGNVYPLSFEYPGTLYDITISLYGYVTDEEYDAFADAKIVPWHVDISQGFSNFESNNLFAFGDIPTIAIPVQITARPRKWVIR